MIGTPQNQAFNNHEDEVLDVAEVDVHRREEDGERRGEDEQVHEREQRAIGR